MNPPVGGVNEFISKFCQWVGSARRNTRAKLASALRRAIHEELPGRDGGVVLEVRALVDSADLPCWYFTHTAWLYPTENGSLACGVQAPNWQFGWSSISRDDFVTDTVGNFFHFARQYVARSRMVGMVGAIALTYDRACEFRFASHGAWVRVGERPVEDSALIHAWMPRLPTVKDATQHLQIRPEFAPVAVMPRGGRRHRELHGWIRSINGLDPFVHRAIFQFWRSTALLEHHFWEEAVTALDGTVSVIGQFAGIRLGVGSNARQSLASIFDLSQKDQRLFDGLYELRCDFGAHPSRSKWWDFGEIYGDEIEVYRVAVKRLLRNFLESERAYRVVEPNPFEWSEWFSSNALMLWDAVWFEHIR